MGGRGRAAVIAAGVVVAGAALWLGRDDEDQAGGPPITPEQCAASADLRLVFQVSPDEEGGDIRGLTFSGEVRQLTDDGASYGPSLSPDGTQIAFMRATSVSDMTGADGTAIHVMDVDGTGVRQLADGEGGFSPAWSPDGRRIAFVRALDRFEDPGRIFVMDADGTSARVLVEHDGPENDMDPSWSPDGERLAFVRRAPDGSAQLMVADADGSDARPVFVGDTEVGEPSWSPDSERLLFVEPIEDWPIVLNGGVVSVLDPDSGAVEHVATPARQAVWAQTGRIYAYASAPAVADVSGAARLTEFEPDANGSFGTGRAVPTVERIGIAYEDAEIDVPACDRDAPALTSADDVPEMLTMTDPSTGEDVQVLTREQAIARLESVLATAPPPGAVAKLVRSDDPAVLEMGVPLPDHGGLEPAPVGPFVWVVGYDDSGLGRGIAGITAYDAATGGDLLSTGGPREAAVFEALVDLAP